MAKVKNADREKQRRTRQSIRKMERDNNKLIREIRQIEKVRWVANDTALAYLYQLRTQLERNDRFIDHLYTDSGLKRPKEACNKQLACYFSPVIAAFIAVITIT